ncbi:MAG: hypothetical protein OK454_11510, partial [Thaumarchaeota archaeon]|nr:hypothetical protein [Nitrososphaerota archaeon]
CNSGEQRVILASSSSSFLFLLLLLLLLLQLCLTLRSSLQTSSTASTSPISPQPPQIPVPRMSAARGFSKALRAPVARQLTSAAQRRTFVSALAAARATAVSSRPAAPARQQVRGVKTIDFAGHKEDVYGTYRPAQCHVVPAPIGDGVS